MVAGGEDELICDFAQYYHVLDWRGLPVRLAATLASGLPEESRSKLKIAGAKAPLDRLLLAGIADQLASLLWRYSPKGTPRPKSIVDVLTGEDEKKAPIRTYRSGEDFDQALQAFFS